MIPRTLDMAEDELDTAWAAIREMLPNDLSKLALRSALVKTFDEAYAAERILIEAIVEHAFIIPPKNQFQDERALCPLCRRGAQDPYVHGFAYPEGLIWHLEGRGPARKCTVMTALWDMSKRSVRDQRGE